MPHRTPAEHLAPLPPHIRNRLLGDGVILEPGAAAVLGRFFAALVDRGERVDAPSRATFETVARSESTLATLLRALERHVPEVGTAAARALRAEWYARRPGRAGGRCRDRAGPPAHAPAHWPPEWRVHYPALLAAPVRPSTIRRHVASLDRLAQLLPGLRARPELNFHLAWCLSEALRAEGIAEITVANYLGALITLGRAGGADESGLSGIRMMQMLARERADLRPKKKEARIEVLHDRGGPAHILERLIATVVEAAVAPAHSAEAEKRRQTAAILAVAINMPPRTGDMSAWVLGRDLLRLPSGCWRLDWRQQKTLARADAGLLWPEVGLILDDLILAGHPDRLVHLRYEMLAGRNWLTHVTEPPGHRLPSDRVQAAIGLPLHDLRTIAADLLRETDPAVARRLVAGLLGHKTARAGDAYRALADGEAAALEWQKIRQGLAQEKRA